MSNNTSVGAVGQTDNGQTSSSGGHKGGSRGRRGGRGRADGVKVDVSRFPKETVVYTIRHVPHERGSFVGTGGVVPLGQVSHLVTSRSAGDAVSMRTYRAKVVKRPDEAVIGVHPLSNAVCVRLDNEVVRSRVLAEQAQALAEYAAKQFAHSTDVPQALKDVSEMQLPVIRAVFTAAEMMQPLDSAVLHGFVSQARRRGLARFVPWNVVAEQDGVVVACDLVREVDLDQTPWVRLKYVPDAAGTYSLETWLATDEQDRPDTVEMLLPFVINCTPDVGRRVRAGQELTSLRDVDVESARYVVWQAFLAPMPWGLDVPSPRAANGVPPTSYESYDLVGVPLPFAAALLRGEVPGPKPLAVVEDVRHMLNETVPNPAAAVLTHGFGPELTDAEQRYVTLTVGADTPAARIAVDHMRTALKSLSAYATDDDLRVGLMQPDRPLVLSGLGRTYVAAMQGMDSLQARGLGVRADFGTRDRRFRKQGPLVDTGVSTTGDAAEMSAAAERIRDGAPVADVLGSEGVVSAADAVLALQNMGS